MKKLATHLKINGTGRGVTATLVMRANKVGRDKKSVCFYERSDGVYEVFYPNLMKQTIFPNGKIYPERETYPGNEDFGKTAWCYTNYQKAKRKYEKLCIT